MANRLQEIAEENQIIISTDVKKLIENRFIIEDIGLKQRIKAFPEIKMVHEVKNILK